MKRFFYTLKQAFKQVLRNRAMTVASIFAITAMLLILSLFFILVINVNTAAQSIQQDYDSIEIYLADETTEEQANEIIADIEQENGVQEAYYKTKEEAMEEFRTRWGENGYLLDSLQENPLPNSVVVMIDDLEQAESIAEKAATYDGVEDVQFYKDTVDKLLSATRYIQIAAIIVMVFLIIVSIVVVSNTIKLTVFNRASEISIMKYVGATNWFIRGPFLAEGIIIGIISAGISIGLSALVYDKIIDVVGNQLLSVMSMPMVPVGFLVYNFVWIFLALGISIGACGSIISMRKFLDA
ncbi:MAG TPA: ABC transporter permease [Candidatus Copromorpha excrementipullorum]|uniref:Cell division protein FtsX n=1 Tax=Candidatus Allocopromorpha excrementipullorum TaxID=2840743 RepID=A0A9D1SV23_9FIRM|nr:ABC transporter permease [Candidatus Copromorpha excrementipullorum]